MSDIFVGYASEDRQRITPLISALTQQGWSVFWDRHLLPGVEFDEVIEAELRKARVALICWSEHSQKSKWVKREAILADELGILFPVMLKDDITIPFVLKNNHFLRLVDWTGDREDPDFRLLIGHLEKLLDKPSSKEAPAPKEAPVRQKDRAPSTPPPGRYSSEGVPLSAISPTARNKGVPSGNVPSLLIADDLLEPALIRLSYPLDKNNFVDGRLSIDKGGEGKGYLLPLTTRFFEIFNADDLRHYNTGSAWFDMTQLSANEVRVRLTIPRVGYGQSTTFERIYADNIVEYPFNISIFPFFRTRSSETATSYRIHLAEQVPDLDWLAFADLGFFALGSGRPLSAKTPKRSYETKQTGDGPPLYSSYFALEKEFDYIRVQVAYPVDASGIIFPKWPFIQPGTKRFNFAIDQGAISTHIEYNVDNDMTCRAFDITPEDLQVATLFAPLATPEGTGEAATLRFRRIIDQEFIPLLLGPGLAAGFPQRTLVAEDDGHRTDIATQVLADLHIPFSIDTMPPENTVTRFFEWGANNPGRNKRRKAFFEILILLMRNKVLLNGGDLRSTRIAWSFPLDMKPGRRSDLNKYWKDLIVKYFNASVEPLPVPASLGAFYYFQALGKIPPSRNRPIVAIDIGSRLTEMAMILNGAPKYLTAFKFGGEVLFGDGPSPNRFLSNGLTNKYIPYYERLFAMNDLSLLQQVFYKRIQTGNSEEVSSFFFSLDHHPDISDSGNFSFPALLAADDDLKVVFLYFYAAIIWHLASLVKQQKLDNPGYLLFSGAGAGVLNLLTSDLDMLARYSSLFFRSRLGLFLREHLNSIQTETGHSREVTARGILLAGKDSIPQPIDVDRMRVFLNTFEEPDIAKLASGQLTWTWIKADLIKKVTDFNDFFIAQNRRFNYSDHFNVSPASWAILTREINEGIGNSLEEYMQYNMDERPVGREQAELEDTLFFFPIARTIAKLIKLLTAEEENK